MAEGESRALNIVSEANRLKINIIKLSTYQTYFTEFKSKSLTANSNPVGIADNNLVAHLASCGCSRQIKLAKYWQP